MDIRYLLLILIGSIFSLVLIYRFIKKRLRGGASKFSGDFEVLEIQASKNQEADKDVTLTSMSAENMFAAMHGLLREDPELQEHLSFEIVSSGTSGIKFFVVTPIELVKFVEGQIYAQYPGITIRVAEDYAKHNRVEDVNFEIARVKFTRPDFFPIKGFRDFETDPLSAFTSAMSQVKGNEDLWFQVVARPIPDVWQEEGFDYVQAVREGNDPSGDNGFLRVLKNVLREESMEMLGRIVTGLFNYKEDSPPAKPGQKAGPSLVRLTPLQETEVSFIENKLSKVGYEAEIKVLSSAEDRGRVDHNLRALLSSLRQFSTNASNKFTYEVASNGEKLLSEYRARSLSGGESLILNSEEIATLFHLPSSNIETPNISWAYSRKSEPPSNLPTKDCVFIGDTMFRSRTVRFGLANGDDRLRHMYVIGKSGVGKSTLFEAMSSQDIINGEGLCVLDPHGETIDKILDKIPENRIKDVVYIDPSDANNPVGLNLMEMEDPSQKNLMASGLLAALKHYFDSWGPRLEYLLNYSLLTLLDVPGTTMLSITRLLEDRNYRNYIVEQVSDPVVRRFWEKEYKELAGNQRFITEALSPIQNKVNRFLASTTIRNVLSQKSTIDIWDIMQNRKILLINLSKGKIGADNSDLLGALLVSRIQFYALQRSRITYEERTPFYLYVDEFQNFATESFDILQSEARKYAVDVVVAHQFRDQLDRKSVV